MPTYEYACRQCGTHLDVVQKFTDESLTTCPGCAGPLRKVFGSIGISFKGSGFYKTDSRSDNGNGKRSDKETSTSEKPTEKSPAAAETTSGAAANGAKSDSPKTDAPKAAS